jgi:hypothetical protein
LRTTILTEELQRSICNAVSLGVPLSKACEALGVAYSTVKTWMAKGRSGRTSVYSSFLASIKKARAQDVQRRLLRISEAARGGAVTKRKTMTKSDGTVVTEETFTAPHWQADAWCLERRYPQLFGRNRLDVAEVFKLLQEHEREKEKREGHAGD